MKILNVNAVLDPVAGGGTAERTFQVSRFLAQAGADCQVLTLDLDLTEQRVAALRPVPVTALRCVARRFYLFPLPESRIGELTRWADIVHLMGHWTLLNALVCREARRQGKPYVVCPAGALRIYGRSRLLKKAYNRLTGRELVRRADAWVAIGSNEVAHFRDYGVEAGRVALIPNGVNPNDFPDADDEGARSRFNLPPDPFVLFLGRLDSIKGPDLLLRAFALIDGAHPGVRLVIAGPDGGMLAALHDIARAAGVSDRVHFVGPVRGADKSRLLHAASLLAVPSRQEAMSIVALEAGICGTPVLITDQCGFDEIAASRGALVVPASEAGLRDGLLRMLTSPAELAAMGSRLREFVHTHYSWGKVASRYLDLYRRVASARGLG